MRHPSPHLTVFAAQQPRRPLLHRLLLLIQCAVFPEPHLTQGATKPSAPSEFIPTRHHLTTLADRKDGTNIIKANCV